MCGAGVFAGVWCRCLQVCGSGACGCWVQMCVVGAFASVFTGVRLKCLQMCGSSVCRRVAQVFTGLWCRCVAQVLFDVA